MTPRPLHIFRRDLRLNDNTSLHAALANGQSVNVGFIFDPRQVGDRNGYKSLFALRFLCESLEEMGREIKKHGGVLNIWYDDPAKIIGELCEKKLISSVHINADYTPFSLDRDAALERVCAQHTISFTAHHDTLLTTPGTILTGSGTPFKVFTPFYKAAQQNAVAAPAHRDEYHIEYKLLSGAQETIPTDITAQYKDLLATPVTSGRTAGLKILNSLSDFTKYKTQRDILAEHGTTHLSAHHKFGTVSVRETLHAAQQRLGSHAQPLTRQLYWRDFFTHVAVLFPHVFGHAFEKKYEHIAWKNSKKAFKRWRTGTTGFPIVDAGMRELNATGYMHNRARMITASFLTKDLHIDWRWGERYFAQRLIDYDPCVNNGSWQWAASTGCDAQPYFRVFNPWLQQKRFDPDAVYIKRWVKELKSVRATALHTLDKKPVNIPNYPAPMVDHSVARNEAIALFKV